jgi:argininosuccinate lyase
MSKKPWEHHKEGGSEADPLAARFVASLDYDTRLYKVDIRGSLAHAAMLAKVGLITEAERAEIERGLKEIEAEIESAPGGITGWPGWKIELEDVHMCIEAALIEKTGDAGRKLHTGRSRNDQVATDLLLWTREAVNSVYDRLDILNSAFDFIEKSFGQLVLPGYTHLQRAQPIAVRGEAAAWRNAFQQCQGRLNHLAGEEGQHREFPLGSGALAGSALPLDRVLSQELLEYGHPLPEMDNDLYRKMLRDAAGEDVAKSLGMEWDDVQRMRAEAVIASSSIYATASRDAAIDFVYALAMTAMWLSRWAEQWIIYATTEFGFITLDAKYTTGSSMMPQKQNPDMLELIRGRCGGVYGHLVALLTMCKGLTIGYNRDLQEDKRHVFAAYDTVSDCLEIAAGIVRTTKFNEQRIRDGLDRGFLDATSLAEYLVTKGVPFRTAHQVVGALVRTCTDSGKYKLEQLSVDEMNAVLTATPNVDAAFRVGDDVYDWLGPDNVVRRYQTAGNAGVSGFEQQLEAWKQRLSH